MNLISRTLPALILGLSGLTLSAASQADSSFSITISSGYVVPHATYVYHDSYRPPARACNLYRRPPAHIDTYVETRIYNYPGYRERHYEYREYREHHGGHHRKHGDRHERRHHTGYARTGYY